MCDFVLPPYRVGLGHKVSVGIIVIIRRQAHYRGGVRIE